MSRKRRDSVAPSLFPFLAVLLCTMGSLVLILMLIVSGAQASAQQVAQESKERVEELEDTLALARNSYQRQLQEGQLDLEQKRLTLQHFEDHILELLGELEDIRQTAKALSQKDDASSEELLENEEEISELEKQLAEAAELLNQKLDEPKGDKPIFAIVPYQGRNGTHRRPIYLECDEAGVTIQPEGILLTTQDLKPPHGPGNPLDATLRVIRAEYRPADGSITSNAYPLLVVRPSGIHNYVLARSAMSGWDDQFGYELIDDEIELTYPRGEPGLAERIATTIDLARQRQQALVMAMPRRFRQEDDFGSFDSGGLAGGGYGESTGNYGASSGSSSGDSAERRGGFGSREIGSSTLGDSPSGSASSPWQGGGFASEQLGGSNGTRNQAGGRIGALGGQRSGDQRSGNPGYGSQGYGGQGYNNSDAALTSNYPGMNRSGATGNSRGENAGSAGAHAGQPAPGSQSAGSQSAGSQSSAPHSSDSQYASSQQSAGSSASGSSSSGGSPGGRPGTSSSAGGSTSAGGRTSAGGGASAPNLADSDPSRGQSPPSLSMNANLAQRSSSPVASALGRNWAWKHGSRTQTPVVRSLHLHVFSDRWVLLPDDGNVEKATVIPFSQSPEARAVQLAESIRQRVEDWGLALAGGYWKPVLVVDTAPDATWRYDQLARLLEGSGLEVQRRARTANPPQPGVRR